MPYVTTATEPSSTVVPANRSPTTAFALDRSPRSRGARWRQARSASPITPPGSTALSSDER
jgi:hypothetical protein